MTDQRSAALSKAAENVTAIRARLEEVSMHLADGEELAALGALSGLAAEVQYVETLLIVLRDLETQEALSAREPTKLRMIFLFDSNRNEYVISTHNEPAEKASQLVRDWNPHLVEGCALIAIDQEGPHSTSEAQDCLACLEIVKRFKPDAVLGRRQQ